MKKALLYTMTLCTLVFGFTSCNDDDDAFTDSVLTTYAKFNILGDELVEVVLGTGYEDAGCTATWKGQDVTSQIVTTGEVDPDAAGYYYINYAYTNEDGYTTSVTRTVVVYDPTVTTDLTGEYEVATGSYRYWFESGKYVKFQGQTVTLEREYPGIFAISDLMGGYYDQYVGYGPDYAMPGYIQLTSDNKIKVISGKVPDTGWGDSYDVAYDGEYDPETGMISWAIEYSGKMLFNIYIQPVAEEED